MKKEMFIGICEGLGYEVEETIGYKNDRRLGIRLPGETVGISLTEIRLLDLLRDINDKDDVIRFLDNVLNNEVKSNIKNVIEYLHDKEYILNNVFPVLLPKSGVDEDKVITTNPTYADDLIIMYKVNLENINDYQSSVALTKEICKSMDIAIDEMKLRAVENFRRNVTIRSMGEVMKDMIGNSDFIPVIEDECNQMIVISRNNNTYGAYGLTDEYTLNKACDKMNTDSIIIIPSSIHEVIVINGNNNDEDINDMIVSVNTTELDESDILSDHCYRYERHN